MSMYEAVALAPSALDRSGTLGDLEIVGPRRWHSALGSSAALVIPGGKVNLGARTPLGSPLRGLAAAAVARGKQVAVTGVGLSGQAARRTGVSARLLTAVPDLLFVRTEATARILVRAGARPPIRVGADPLWLALARELSRVDVLATVLTSGADGTGVLGRRSSWKTSDKLLVAGCLPDHTLTPLVAAAVAQLTREGLRVMVQTGPGADDAKRYRSGPRLASSIAERVVGTEVLEGPLSVQSAIEQSASARLVMAMDWPSTCVAAAVGTPLLAVTEDPEVAALAALLGQATVTPQAGEKAISRAALAALDGEGAAADGLASQLQGARGGLGMLRMLLDRGKGKDLPALGALTLHPEPWAS
ncbi:MAG: hypothetical protein M0Z87_00390 [Actinomycetota bacterium]|nr:hypothetical protein [Actinomycetota bacterium]